MFDPLRGIALLWRGCGDPEGAACWSPEDEHQADLLQVAGFGNVSKRQAKPHQHSIPFAQKDAWVTYFEPNDVGRDLWSEIVELMIDAYAERVGPPREQAAQEG